jgi:uncharacterized protein YceH (UPF0502 family)
MRQPPRRGAAASEELSTQADSLKEFVSVFKIKIKLTRGSGPQSLAQGEGADRI